MRLKSIRAKLTTVIVLTMLIAVGVLGGVNYWIAKRVMTKDTDENLASLALHNAEKLGMWLEIRKGEISTLAATPAVVNGDPESAISYLKAENKRNGVYAFFFLIDKSGSARLTTGETPNVADRPYFKQAMTGKVVISNPVISKVDGRAVVVVAAPIVRNGSVDGVLAATVGLGDMNKLVKKIKVGESGYAYAVQEDGLAIIHPSEKLAMKLNFLQDSTIPQSLKEIVRKMAGAEQGVGRYTFDGVEKYAAYAPIAGTSWSLAVTVPVAEMSGKLRTLLWSTLVTLLLVGGAAFICSYGIAARFTRPLLDMNLLLADVANGDLTKRLKVTSDDELGETCGCFNDFVQKIHDIIAKVTATSASVLSAADRVNETSRQMVDSADTIAVQVNTVATAGEEMAATAGDIAQNCQMASEGSRDANDEALAGSRVVEETVSVMGSIADRVKGAATAVEGLGARSDQIGTIVGAIEDIADQTNLLALNAAIEAARAGEQGRGFAVVADEVRALAERTTKATHEIGDMIRAIQQETKGAVGAMEEGVNEVVRGTEKAARSGEALEQILHRIGDVSTQVNQVAVAAEEQTATTSEISRNMHEISEMINATARGAKESAAAAGELDGAATELQQLVDQFRL